MFASSVARSSIRGVSRSSAVPAVSSAQPFPQVARTSFAHSARRGYASAPSSGSSSNLPLLLALGGLGGLGAWYGLGGFDSGNVKKVASEAEGALGLGALSKDEFREFTLKEVKPYNHDSAFYIFELPDNAKPGMGVASAVLIKGAGDDAKDKDGKPVIRPYTPVSSPATPGHIDFLIKRYPNGAMTSHIHGLKPGDKVAIKGPLPKLPYKANEFEHIGMIAGGTGITPMWQVIQQIASDKNDKTNVTLIYTNKSEKDILLREEFDRLSKSDPRFKIIYGLDKKSGSVPASTFEGYITHEIISQNLPLPGKADKVKVLVCGPPPMYEAISGGKGPKGSQGDLKGLLADAGYQADQVYKF
ncbi:ferredoxin reductase-like protein [Ceraceosorus guamensis]|uniref:NADH-cytochrome b5 reductase n=1 Tax=Ceraceosorus guamensis TaxID=1522189 RepID=A0A316W395_9BASI|nr:ferredoxin reductase-like protein [Ceraceosorus guamensis]PWN44367.1 ferredoxin reductase-like protein [Ceraceosorus guamensis]